MTARLPTIEHDGWTLVSAEERQSRHPDTFRIPDRRAREALCPGDAAQLLFDIETRQDGRVVDRGVDRLWVIVTRRTGHHRYVGVLDSDPGHADGLSLRRGVEVAFSPAHVIAIERPPAEYLVNRFGTDFAGADDGIREADVTGGPGSEELADRLFAMEERFWKADAEFYRAHVTPDCLMLFPGVGVMNRESAIQALAGAPRWAEVEMGDRRITMLSQTAAMLSYRATARREGDRTPYAALVSSAYVERDGSWTLAFHHQSPLGG